MFKEDDLIKYNSFKRVLNEGMFEIKGEATIPVALLFDWYNNLGKRMKQDIEYQAAKENADFIVPQGKDISEAIHNPKKKKSKKVK